MLKQTILGFSALGLFAAGGTWISSGYTFEQREGYQKMRRKLFRNQYDILIIKDLSRFSRRNGAGRPAGGSRRCRSKRAVLFHCHREPDRSRRQTGSEKKGVAERHAD